MFAQQTHPLLTRPCIILLDSSRLLFATWWIFITILTAYYTANLTAFLTLSRFTLPINAPEDIAQKGYRWITKNGSTVKTYNDEVGFFLTTKKV